MIYAFSYFGTPSIVFVVAATRFSMNMMGAGQPGFSNMVMQMRQQTMMQPMGGLPTAQAPIMPMGVMSSMAMAGSPMSNNIENVCRSIMASVSI